MKECGNEFKGCILIASTARACEQRWISLCRCTSWKKADENIVSAGNAAHGGLYHSACITNLGTTRPCLYVLSLVYNTILPYVYPDPN